MNVQSPADVFEVTLSTPDAVDQVIFEGPGALGHLGGVEPDIAAKKIRLRIGRRPTILNVQKLYESLGLSYPGELKLFEQYKVWLFSFNLQLRQDGGFQSVRQFGCQVKYPEGYAISIVSLLPDSEFVTKASWGTRVAATLEANGEFNVPKVESSVGGASVKAGAGFHAEANANAKVDLSFAVMTDKVVATGCGDFLAEWSVKRVNEPLLGDQAFYCTVLIPKNQRQISLEIRAFVTVGTAFSVPARLNSEWLPISAPLTLDGEVGID